MKKYLITSREFYTDTPAVFRNILHEQFSMHNPDFALYRDKSNPNYDTQAAHFVEVCNQFEDIKSFIHQKVDLALNLGAFGVHLTSKQFDKIEYAKSKGLKVVVSTHSLDELKKVQELGADYATYSPIFDTPNKPLAKGVDNLIDVLNQVDIKIFALGGIISQKEVELLEQTPVYGFASIRYFY